MPCGFESHLSHQKNRGYRWYPLFFCAEMGLEEAGHAVGGAKNMPATCFLGRGRVPQLPDAPRSGWGWKLHFPNIGKATLTGGLFFGREMGLVEAGLATGDL